MADRDRSFDFPCFGGSFRFDELERSALRGYGLLLMDLAAHPVVFVAGMLARILVLALIPLYLLWKLIKSICSSGDIWPFLFIVFVGSLLSLSVIKANESVFILNSRTDGDSTYYEVRHDLIFLSHTDIFVMQDEDIYLCENDCLWPNGLSDKVLAKMKKNRLQNFREGHRNRYRELEAQNE